MSCERAMKRGVQSGQAAGIPAMAGQVAFVAGVTAARAGRAGWRAQQFVDKKLVNSPIPTQLGLLALAGGMGASLTYSLLQTAVRVQRRCWVGQRCRRNRGLTPTKVG